MHVIFTSKVDISKYPTIEYQPRDDSRPIKDGDTIIFPDFDGNILKFLHFLLYIGAIDGINALDYKRVVEICTKKSPDSDELKEFNDIIDKIRIKKKINVKLIGDELGDAGLNDYFTLQFFLKLLKEEKRLNEKEERIAKEASEVADERENLAEAEIVLSKKKKPFRFLEIMMSNHTDYFFKVMNKLFPIEFFKNNLPNNKFFEKCKEWLGNSKAGLGPMKKGGDTKNGAPSMERMYRLIIEKLVNPQEIYGMVKDIYHSQGRVKLLSYTEASKLSNNPNKLTMIYSHAPIGWDQIKEIAQALGVDHRAINSQTTNNPNPKPPQESKLIQIIDEVNEKFQILFENGGLHTSWDKIKDFDFRKIFKTPPKDLKMAYQAFAKAYEDIIWNTEYSHLYRRGGYFIHGHHPNDPDNTVNLESNNNLGKRVWHKDGTFNENNKGNHTFMHIPVQKVTLENKAQQALIINDIPPIFSPSSKSHNTLHTHVATSFYSPKPKSAFNNSFFYNLKSEPEQQPDQHNYTNAPLESPHGYRSNHIIENPESHNCSISLDQPEQDEFNTLAYEVPEGISSRNKNKPCFSSSPELNAKEKGRETEKKEKKTPSKSTSFSGIFKNLFGGSGKKNASSEIYRAEEPQPIEKISKKHKGMG